jgi:tetratricopeptide (TPR) repeat protein
MNRAFTHAEDMGDMATAYYASTQAVAFMAERFGMPKLRRMLVLWGEGKRTNDVVKEALGVTIEEVDTDFRRELGHRLAGYRGQFVPPSRPEDLGAARAAVDRAPKGAKAHSALALAWLGRGKEKEAEAALGAALALDATEPTALWLTAQLKKMRNDAAGAAKTLRTLAASKSDGLAVQMALAEVAESPQARKASLEAAHQFDPLATPPLQALWEQAIRDKDEPAETSILERIVAIEENDAEAHRRLVTLLLREKRFADARRVAEAMVHVDVESSETHRLHAEALLGMNQRKEALAALEMAVLGRGKPEERALSHLSLARLLDAKGKAVRAKELRKRAEELVQSAATGPI